MHVLYARCAALDLGKDFLVAVARVQEGSKVSRQCRSFATTTGAVLELSGWLTSQGVTHVVMEATGAYWKSVWHILEGQFELTLANPATIRNLPGRKSDVNDATWMADLLAHGLVRGSFVPPAPIAELRDLTRTRKQLGRDIARHTQRIQKVLDTANLKVTGLISDVIGVSGRTILKALIAGETNPERLADLVHPRLRASREALIEALRGRLTGHQRLLLKMHLELIEGVEGAINDLDREVAKLMEPFREQSTRLKRVPGLSDVNVPALIAEIGVDMSPFRTHRHLLSWARMTPRLDESAGKVHSRRTLKGANWVKPLLVQAAWAAVRTKDTYLRAQYLRLRSRRGAKKAILAVAASILTAVYYMLRDGTEYRDLGFGYFDNRDRRRVTRRYIRKLQDLGYRVQLSNLVA